MGGLVDIEGNGVVLLPPRDSSALRSTIERLLGDRAERLRLGVAARERAQVEFSHETTARGLVNVYGVALRAAEARR